MQPLKIMTVLGTRPEMIKLAPLINVIQKDPDCQHVLCVSTQQRALQNEMLAFFGITPDYDLDVMKKGQDLFYITHTILEKIQSVLKKENPDMILVQGDTSTAFSAALAGFYEKKPIVHLEAGLRTGNVYSPFPEEMNRRLLARLATIHMAPTRRAVKNLKREGIVDHVFHVGNLIVDSVAWIRNHADTQNTFIQEQIRASAKKIVITIHRRENLGKPFQDICNALKTLCQRYPEDIFIWPLHPNANTDTDSFQSLKDHKNIFIISPLSYVDLLLLLQACSVIISDSGGLQEEACLLGKRILILRETTERPEVIEEGLGVLVGSDQEKICHYFSQYRDREETSCVKKISQTIYGKPGVSDRILSIIKKIFIQ